jgi:serine/threonine-protein kinase
MAAAPGIPRPGELIAAKFEVERVLGAGGMGVVLAARHVQLGQRVAIKFMHAEAARDPSAAARFLREARAAVALTSEHVTRVLDVGTLESGAPYMVMEYLAGVDLGDVLKSRGPLAMADAVGVILQACEAIGEAHSVGIVHRDLKPSNLFVTTRRDGTTVIKVLDFGISKTIDFNSAGVESNLTASGLVIGSPCYMSPEQVRSAKAVDGRADIWALGAITFELVTGVRPFEGETLGETFARILTDAAPTVKQFRPDVPDGFSAVVAQCLERRVEMRIQNVGELASKLLPYGLPDAAGSVERILRICGLAPAPRSEFGRLDSMSQVGAGGRTPMGLQRSTSRGVETETPWHNSGRQFASSSEGWRRAWLVALAGLVVAVSAATMYATSRHSQLPARLSAAPPSASIPIAGGHGEAGELPSGLARVVLAAPGAAAPTDSDPEYDASAKPGRSGVAGRSSRSGSKPVAPAMASATTAAPPPAPLIAPVPSTAPKPASTPPEPQPKPSPTPSEKDIF